MSNKTISLTDWQSLTPLVAGGKAASLAHLLKNGFNIPAGFVVKAETSLTSKDAEETILNAFDKLNSQNVAVRSSATAEDSQTSSWAGQLETILGATRDTLLEAVDQCRQSINSKRARVYAKHHKFLPTDQKVAVIVQAMVNSEISGVLFSANPVTNNANQVVIEAVFGLGELLVQGLTTPETIVASKTSDTNAIRSPHHQTRQLVFNDGQVTELNLPVKLLSRDILTKNQIDKLVELARRIENLYGCPQDIEFAIAEDQIFILQSRPITTLQVLQ